MKIKLVSAGESVLSYVDVASQTFPVLKDKNQHMKESTRSSSKMALEEERGETAVDSELTEDDLIIQAGIVQAENVNQADDTAVFAHAQSPTVIADVKKRPVIKETLYVEREKIFPSQSNSVAKESEHNELIQGENDESHDNHLEDQSTRSELISMKSVIVKHKVYFYWIHLVFDTV